MNAHGAFPSPAVCAVGQRGPQPWVTPQRERVGWRPWEGPHLNEAATQCKITLRGVCRTRSTHTEQTSREDKDEKTQENYSAPWCYHPLAELEVRDRTVLKMLGKEERPFTILYTDSKLSISICPVHCALLKCLFYLNVSPVSQRKQKSASVTLNIVKTIRFPCFFHGLGGVWTWIFLKVI